MTKHLISLYKRNFDGRPGAQSLNVKKEQFYQAVDVRPAAK